MDSARDLVEISLAGECWRHGSTAPDPAKVTAAARAVAEDGAVIVADAVDPELLERLAARMDDDLARLLTRPDRAENFAVGHLQQDPPPAPDCLHPEILAHPFAVRVAREVLRQPVRLTGYSNNTNLAGSQAQPVHVDEGQRWPGLSRPHPAAQIVVNIPLSTAAAGSGAIELWPGTHLDVRMCQYSATPDEGASQAVRYLRSARRADVAGTVNRRVGLTVPETYLDERRAVRPPTIATTRAGSLIIRDPRLWHRGTANGAERRFMLAVTYDPPWRRVLRPIRLPSVAQKILRECRMEAEAEYTDQEFDHLSGHGLLADSPLRRTGLPRPQEET